MIVFDYGRREVHKMATKNLTRHLITIVTVFAIVFFYGGII